jgi:DNA-directed RNA polymerase beta subunit
MNLAEYESKMQRMVESYFSIHGPAPHQKDSYENFLNVMLPDIIEENSPIDIYCPKQNVLHNLQIKNICLKKPTIQEANGFIRKIFPNEAFLRKQTYCVDVFVDLFHKVYKGKTKTHLKLKESKIYRQVLLCKIPCMINSSGCHNHGNLENPLRDTGTFIINGFEKVMITQEHLKCNSPYVFKIKRPIKYTHRCEVRSFHSSKIRSTSTLNIYICTSRSSPLPKITLSVPFIKHPIPLSVIFRILNVDDLASMLYFIVGTTPNPSQKLCYKAQSILSNNNTDTNNLNHEELYDWIGIKGSTEKHRKKRIQYIKHDYPNCSPKLRSAILDIRSSNLTSKL